MRSILVQLDIFCSFLLLGRIQLFENVRNESLYCWWAFDFFLSLSFLVIRLLTYSKCLSFFIFLVLGLLWHSIWVYLTLIGCNKQFSVWKTFMSAVCEESCCSVFLSTLGIISLLKYIKCQYPYGISILLYLSFVYLCGAILISIAL